MSRLIKRNNDNIPPHTHAPMHARMQKYAKWSQRLNVEIYVAYAEANGHATEALSNIRTVKAMSTELQGMVSYTWCCIGASSCPPCVFSKHH